MANGKWPIYLGLAIGTLGVGIGLYEYWRRKTAAAKLEKLIRELNVLIADYEDEAHEMMAKINRSFETGLPMDEAEVNREAAEMSVKEENIAAKQEEIDEEVGALGEDPLRNLWRALEIAGIITVAMAATLAFVAVGYGISRVVLMAIKAWNDRQGPPPSIGCPKCAVRISGATADQLQANLLEHYRSYHTVDIPTMVTVLPDVRTKFFELPEWAQESLAVDMGIVAWYELPEWEGAFRGNPWLIFTALCICLVITVICPVAAPATATGAARVAGALAPAVA